MGLGFEELGVFGDPETLVTVVVVAAIAMVALGILRRVGRYQAVRSTARSQRWRWLGSSTEFGRLVAGAFPELVDRAKRSARRTAAQRRSGGNGRQRATNLALDLSGAGTQARAAARGRYVAVASGTHGEVTVGEVRISAQAYRRGFGRRGGRGHGSSSMHCTAAAAKLPAGAPQVRLAPRSLLGRLWGSGDAGLPEELGKRFEVVELGGAARAALIDSGAWRELLTDGVKVRGLTIGGGRIVVMTRQRIRGSRARALVEVVERLTAALPKAAAHADTPGRDAGATGPPIAPSSATGQ
jgi:hypothetical protein